MGLRGIEAEVSPALAVHLREVVAGDSRLSHNGIGRHRKRRAHLVAQQAQHLLAIATAQLPIARSVEVQLVRTVATPRRTNHVGCMQRLGQGVNLLVHGHTLALAISLHHLAGQQRHLLRLQLQVA